MSMSSSSARGEPREGSGRPAGLRIAAGLIGLICIQVLAYWDAAGSTRGAFPSLALPGALALLAGWRCGPLALLAAVVGVVAAGLAAGTWPQVERLVPLASHVSICAAFAWLFGRTLLPGREPLVTQMARLVHGSIPPPIVAYARNVTWAWTLFFIAMGAVSMLLFVLAPLPAWSAFANLLLLPQVGLMFLAEYGYRTLKHRWFSHATLAQSIGAFRRLRTGASDARLP